MSLFPHLAGLLAAGAFVAATLTGPSRADDREVLPTNVQPLHYKIDLVPDMAKPSFAGHAAIDVEVTEPTSTITLNAKDMTFDSVSLSGVTGAPKVAVDDDKEQASFTFAAPVAPGKYTLDIAYHGKIYETSAGLFVTPYQGDDGKPKTMLTTQFEPGYARRLAPMWDEPAIKSVFELSLTVPDGLLTLANTPAVATTEVGNGLKKVQFGPTPKMSSYLLFVGAGEFDRIVGKAADTEIGVITRKGASERGRFALETASQILPYYNDYFGVPFPLPKLDLLGAPGAGGFGAMENWGAIFYFESALLVDPALTTEGDRQRIYSTIAHEMAHQWFGDLVTMAWWDDLWLNEGFASWMQAKASDQFHPEWDTWLQELRRQQDAMDLDSRASTHPIVQHVRDIGEAESAFDDITYSKGQAVIRMMEAYLGNDAFRDGVRAYMKAHAYGNTITQDLWKELEAASKTPVKEIAHDFTTQPGVPLIIVDAVRCDGDQSVVSLHQERFGTDETAKDTERWHVPVVLQAIGGAAPARAVVDGKAEIKVPGCGAVKVNAGAAGYFRTLYPAEQFAQLKADFGKLAPIDQLGMLYDTWALGESGYQPVTDYLGLAGAVTYDADPLIWQQIANTYGALEVLYRGQDGRETFLAYARGRLKPEMQKIGWTAQPGEKPNVSILRDTLIQVLAQLGDPETIAEANKRFASFLGDPTVLSGATKRAVLRAVAMHGDAATWEKIHGLAKAAGNPLEQRLYLIALAATMDDGLAEKTLDLSISDEVPKQFSPRLIGAVAVMHPDLVWSFLQAHQSAIFDRVDAMGRFSLVPDLAATSTDAKRADELRAYFAKTFPKAPEAEMNRAMSKIRYGAGVKAKRLPEINDWLNRSQ